IEDLMEDGLSREEATRKARREFGNVTLIEERSREVWQWPGLETLFQDLRFGARMLLKQPGFSLIAVLTLALGIGANTAIFSLVNAALLKTLPVSEPEQLVVVATGAPGRQSPPGSGFSYPLFKELRDKQSSFSGIFARAVILVSLSASGQAERV